jgi:hypothetical protein
MSSISGFLVLLGVLFIIFKFTGIIAWSWLAVMAPILVIMAAVFLQLSIIILIACGAVLYNSSVFDKVKGK